MGERLRDSARVGRRAELVLVLGNLFRDLNGVLPDGAKRVRELLAAVVIHGLCLLLYFAVGPHPHRLPRLAHARRADSGRLSGQSASRWGPMPTACHGPLTLAALIWGDSPVSQRRVGARRPPPATARSRPPR